MSNHTEIRPRFLGITDAARYVGMGRTMFYHEISTGTLRLIKIGRKSVVPIEDLDSLADRIIADGQYRSPKERADEIKELGNPSNPDISD